MINKYLINPESIVVVGGSSDLSKPGGKVLKNIIDGNFLGKLRVINPKASTVQGIKSYTSPDLMPDTDLAILAIAAKFCKEAVSQLVNHCNTKAFIILSAGFSEENKEGRKLEAEIVDMINRTGGSLIGPNCIGVLTQTYNGIFTEPVPSLDPGGVDFVSGSGATAVFIMESAIPNGVKFSSVFSVGNSAQSGVEDVLKYLDETFVAGKSSMVKALYFESIKKPDMLLKHSASLISKGCKIAAIKAGTSEAGSRAASSHTGAMANPDKAVDSLFTKAGIIRCHSRLELAALVSVLMHPIPTGRNVAIVTHAGGPAVMMTDALAKDGIDVPHLEGPKAEKLLEKLHPGSSTSNPIDLLATGNAEQLGETIDACNRDFEEIDAIVVIFGSPGLFSLDDVYGVLDEKMKSSSKPIYPVLPSLITAGREVREFISKGRLNFPDEVVLARALGKVININPPAIASNDNMGINENQIRKIIDSCNNGYLSPENVASLLDASGISRVFEKVARTENDLIEILGEAGFPIAMKVVGPVHKSDVGGVVLGVDSMTDAVKMYHELMKINETTGVLVQTMASGLELFAGVKKEESFGHLVMAGLGGIFIEVLKDVNSGLAPLSINEVDNMISSLQGYKMLEGIRGKEGVNIDKFKEIVLRISKLVEIAPEIFEMDLNPLLGSEEAVVAVDARIRIEK